ncbi:hypothetical protein BOO92_09840 [Vibrio navarrensis]|uniref:carbohydrate-binding protein n=1 Tax=Vibrio navarrensis TaxID=29495 RepID=UPI001866E9B9|nr:carbohydrate-binding protein [Vibrio navarrensis]MBE3653332.1 hypothetical protein [Vibrio navarrensis]MBE3656972.1 hypothetical protein [Vibrio navarrensis]
MSMQSGGGEEGGNECSTTDANAEQYPAWDASTIYTNETYTNETVSHNSFVYQAKWWTQGNEPGSDSVWVNIGPAACH